MRIPRLCLGLSILAPLLAGGCDSRSAQLGAAQEKLDRALALFTVAQQGYAPVDGAGLPRELEPFRQEQLNAVITDLNDVRSIGSDQQKTTASRLLASAHLSAARYATRDALANYAALSATTPVLDATLRAAERAWAQVAASNTDYDAALSQIAGDAAALALQQAELQRQAAELNQQMTALRGEQEQFNLTAHRHTADARAALDAAFLAEGDARETAQIQADAASRRAAEASVESERRQVQLDLNQRRLDVVQAQLNTLAAQLADLKAQADQTRQLQAQSQSKIAELKSLVAERSASLHGEFAQRAQTYAGIHQQFASAAAHAEQAVGLLDGSGSDRLGALMDQVHVNTEWALAGGAWASVVDLVASISEQIGLEQASTYRAAHQLLVESRNASASAARAAISAAREQATSVDSDSAAQAALLEGYAQRLGS